MPEVVPRTPIAWASARSSTERQKVGVGVWGGGREGYKNLLSFVWAYL